LVKALTARRVENLAGCSAAVICSVGAICLAGAAIMAVLGITLRQS
jgi:hypothetical protein